MNSGEIILLVLCISTITCSSHSVQVQTMPFWVPKMCQTYNLIAKCPNTSIEELSKIPTTKFYFNPQISSTIEHRRDLPNKNQLPITKSVVARIFIKNLTHGRKSNKNYNKTKIVNETRLGDNQLNSLRTVSVNVKVVAISRPGHISTPHPVDETEDKGKNSIAQAFVDSLEQFERFFYITTFDKLAAMNAVLRHDNGISFVQSGLFLQLALIGLSTEVDEETKREIDQQLRFNATDAEKIDTINEIISSLPKSNNDTKFHWGTRLMLGSDTHVSQQFRNGAAAKLQLKIDNFNETKTPYEMANILNKLIETDTRGVLRNTFDEDDLSSNVEAVLITTMYLRARWRSAPTLLNGTHLFHNSITGPPQTVRMIRINDIMKYATLPDWKAQAIEIHYFHPDLSLLILVPNGSSLKDLAEEVSNTDVGKITEKMRPIRIAAILPLYTLRMTLLLPNKLRNMGLSRLVSSSDNGTHAFRISHAVQRLMFWSEAGRYAFKDDGLEWDEPPEREVLIDRPYIFYVRWNNITLMNGNFVL